MTITELVTACNAYLVLNPLQTNVTVITEGTQVYSHVGEDPTFEFLENDNVIVIKRGETYGA